MYSEREMNIIAIVGIIFGVSVFLYVALTVDCAVVDCRPYWAR